MAFGNDAVMRAAETRHQPYYKLRLTAKVKRLVRDLFGTARWEDVGREPKPGYSAAKNPALAVINPAARKNL